MQIGVKAKLRPLKKQVLSFGDQRLLPGTMIFSRFLSGAKISIRTKISAELKR